VRRFLEDDGFEEVHVQVKEETQMIADWFVKRVEFSR